MLLKQANKQNKQNRKEGRKEENDRKGRTETISLRARADSEVQLWELMEMRCFWKVSFWESINPLGPYFKLLDGCMDATWGDRKQLLGHWIPWNGSDDNTREPHSVGARS